MGKRLYTEWQHTQCTKSGFKPLIPNSKFIQILHISGCHWIVASNITPSDQSCSLSSVGIYDSIKIMSVSDHLKKQISYFAHPMSDTYIIFDIIDIQSQPNSSDCGLFAIACATELVEGFDPATCHWSCSQMRSHLMQGLVEGKLKRFPCTKKRRVPFGRRVRKSEKKLIYCICRMPNDKKLQMAECTSCLKWPALG